MMKSTGFLAAAVAACAAVAGSGGVARDVVRVSDFGYDEADSTRFLQAAIDSGAKRVVIDAKRWVSLPLWCRGEQEIFFEDGAVVEAKKGAFLGKSDTLFTAAACTNLTIGGKGEIRMHHDDYLKPPYEKSEFRHAISLKNSANVHIWGLKIRNGGGDGVYVGGRGPKNSRVQAGCRDIWLEDLYVDSNVRQGLSVTYCDGLTVERCSFLNTRGLPPSAGIDFEPNSGYNRMHRVVVRDCVFGGNASLGICFALGRVWPEADPTFDITVERCRFIRDCVGGGGKGGRIVVKDCIFEDPKAMPLGIGGGPLSPPNCKVEGCVVRESGKDVPIDDKWLRENAIFLSSATDVVSRAVHPDLGRAEVFDAEPGKMRSFFGEVGVKCRGLVRLVAYADSPRRLKIKAEARLRKSSAASLSVTRASGEMLEERALPTDGIISFDAPAKGFYVVDVALGKGSTLSFRAADCPVAFDISGKEFSIRGTSGAFAFHVPPGTERFEALVAGAGGECCGAALYRPDGSVAWSNGCISAWCGHLQRGTAQPGLWRLSVGRPSRGVFEDMKISLTGVPGLLFADPERHWK